MLAAASRSHGQVFQGTFAHDLGGNDSGSIDPIDAYGQSFLNSGDDSANFKQDTSGNYHNGAHLYLTNKFSSYKGSYLYTGSTNTGAVANLPVGTLLGPGIIPAGTTGYENNISNTTDNDIAYTDSSTGLTYNANSGSAPTQFSVGTTGYYAFSIQPNGGSQTDYGYASITFDSDGNEYGNYAYNTTGGSITVAPFQSTEWNSSNSSGDFSNAANWISGVPGGVGYEANFGSYNTVSGGITVNIASPTTLGTLFLNNKFANYTLSGTGSLSMNSATGAVLTDQMGTHTISVPITFASTGALNVLAGTSAANGNAAIPNSLTISAPLTFNSSGSIHVGTLGSLDVTGTTTLAAGQTLSITTDAFYGAVTATASFAAFNVGTGANVSFNYNYQAGVGVIPISSLTLAASSTATLTAVRDSSNNQGKIALQLGGLTMDPTATINVQTNDLIIQGNTSLAVITAAAGRGFNGGSWNGSGISSSIAAADSKHLTAVGVIENSTDGVNPIYGGSLGTFDGVNPNATDILVRYTYYGDANLDGQVDGSDYTLIDAGFNSRGTLTGWYHGDFNYDGKIDGSDYSLIDNAFNTQQGNLVSAPGTPAALFAGGSSAVPEPTSLSLLALGAVAMLRRKRDLAQ
jgi:hypothetical protein